MDSHLGYSSDLFLLIHASFKPQIANGVIELAQEPIASDQVDNIE